MMFIIVVNFAACAGSGIGVGMSLFGFSYPILF
jgi:hypothetical protein